MENTNTLIIAAVAVAFILIIGYTLVAKAKRKSASWTGTVIDKNVTETASNATNDINDNSGISFGNRTAVNRSYTLHIRDDANNEFDWSVGSGFYESVTVGDRLTKSPGTETPTKI